MRFRCTNCGEWLETDVVTVECPICNSKQKNPSLNFAQVGEHELSLKRRPSLCGDSNTAEIREARRLATSRQPLVCGIFATYAFTEYGSAYACGSNTSYNFYSKKEEPCGQCEVGPVSDVVQIVCAPDHAFLLRSNGKVVVLGDRKKYDTSKWTDIVQVATGVSFGLGLKANGTVVTCGITNTPYCRVEKWTDIIAVYCSNVHTVGLKKDGTVLAIGTQTKDNWDIVQGRQGGQCDVSSWTDIVEIACGNESTIGLRADGTVLACGSDTKFNDAGTVDLPCSRLEVDKWSNVVSIACSQHHTVGLKADGTVVACGDNAYGQCNVGEWADIVEVVCGIKHTLGLKSDGSVVACGDNSDGQCNVSKWKSVVDIACGWTHTVCTRADGTVVACGSCYRKSKQTKDLSVYCDRLAVQNWRHVGSNNVLEALRLLAVGKKQAAEYLLYTYSDYGEGAQLLARLQSGEELSSYAKQRIAEMTAGFRVAIDAEAARVATEERELSEKRANYIFKKEEAVRLAAEKRERDAQQLEQKRKAEYDAKIAESTQLIDFSTYLRAKGAFFGNSYAAVALQYKLPPVFVQDSRKSKQMPEGLDIVAVACGEFHTVCLKANGTVSAEGKNEDGRCLTDSWRRITAIACGAQHTVGLRSDGTVVACGSNVERNPHTYEEREIGQCRVSEWTNISAIACGAYHTVGLRKDGTVVACGSNMEYEEGSDFVRRGQCLVSEWTDIVAIACGAYFTAGLKKDGTVVACGDNNNSQCKTEALMNIVQIACGSNFIVALQRGGFVSACGESAATAEVKNWRSVMYIACGNNCCFAVKADGSAVASGDYNSELLSGAKLKLNFGFRYEALTALAEGKTIAAGYALGLINGGDPLIGRIRSAKEQLGEYASAEALAIERTFSLEEERKQALIQELALLPSEIAEAQRQLDDAVQACNSIKGLFVGKKKKLAQDEVSRLTEALQAKQSRLQFLQNQE